MLISGSQSNTWVALTRLSPDEFALASKRKHSIPGSFLNLSTPPLQPVLAKLILNWPKALFSIARKSRYCENKMAFAPGSFSLIHSRWRATAEGVSAREKCGQESNLCQF